MHKPAQDEIDPDTWIVSEQLPEEYESPVNYDTLPNADDTEKAFYSGEMVEVVIVTFDDFDGRYMVLELGSKKTYLVDKNQLAYSVNIQKVSRTVLSNAEEPYNWDEEINRFVYSKEDIRLALHKVGMTQKADLNFKKFLATLLQSGVLPIVEEK